MSKHNEVLFKRLWTHLRTFVPLEYLHTFCCIIIGDVYVNYIYILIVFKKSFVLSTFLHLLSHDLFSKVSRYNTTHPNRINVFNLAGEDEPDPCDGVPCEELTCETLVTLPGDCCPVCTYDIPYQCPVGRAGRKCKSLLFVVLYCVIKFSYW